MPLKLMYITSRPETARIAEECGVDRIFVDMEYIGKSLRQGGMDTVQSHHTLEDVGIIRGCISRAELLVRCNPIHEAGEECCSSKDEIDGIIERGADIIMLPYFKTVDEVKLFISYVGGRARTMLLFETAEAVSVIDEILTLEGINEVFIGINDLSLSYGKKFMFELLADGTVDRLCEKFRQKGLPYGFGGIASLGKGAVKSDYIIPEHYRLGSTCVILSRSFCNTSLISDPKEIARVFANGVKAIRDYEEKCKIGDEWMHENHLEMCRQVQKVVEGL